MGRWEFVRNQCHKELTKEIFLIMELPIYIDEGGGRWEYVRNLFYKEQDDVPHP